MKLTRLTNLLVLGLLLTLAAAGCRKHPVRVTPLPGQMIGSPKDLDKGNALAGDNANGLNSNPAEGIPANPEGAHDGWTENRDVFQANTVHFAFDSSEVKASEQGNVSAVADYLKGHSEAAVKVEGHCDERGTAEYNRALGDRRASAIREELVKLGVAASRVDTISYGFDRPVDPGHNEAAWSKNRRGEFVLLTPPTTPTAAAK